MKRKPYQPNKNLPLQKGRFSIDDFSTTAHLIAVQYNTPNMSENITLELCRSCFEQWLDETGRLEWVTDTTGYDGDHYQQSGTLAIDDYWQYGDYDTHTSDLKAFVIAEIKSQKDLD